MACVSKPLLALIAVLVVGSPAVAGFKIIEQTSPYDLSEVGIYEMPIQNEDPNGKLTCGDVNYEEAELYDSRRRLAKDDDRGIARHDHAYSTCESRDNCAKIIVFNDFPSPSAHPELSRMNVSLDGFGFLQNVSKGFTHSKLLSTSDFREITTVDVVLTAGRGELSHINDDDEPYNWRTYVGSEMAHNYRPFQDERFFRFYIALNDVDKYYEVSAPVYYDDCPFTLRMTDILADPSFPTPAPSPVPTSDPSYAGSAHPTMMPTQSQAPSSTPTTAPSSVIHPTMAPTNTSFPTMAPTVSPTAFPTGSPNPSATPTVFRPYYEGWEGVRYTLAAYKNPLHAPAPKWNKYQEIDSGTMHGSFDMNETRVLCRREYTNCYSFNVSGTRKNNSEVYWELEYGKGYSDDVARTFSGFAGDGVRFCISTEMPTSAPTLAPTDSTVKPSPAPSVVPTTFAPSASPAPTVTSSPTLSGKRIIHPYLLLATDGPFATMYGFNQTKMDELTEDGTVVVMTSTVMTNVSCTNSDAFCMGNKSCTDRNDCRGYEGHQYNTTYYNRTYHPVRDQFALLCTRNSTDKVRRPLANVSFTDLSILLLDNSDLDRQWLGGTLSLHELSMLTPTMAPVSDATASPTPARTPAPTPGPGSPTAAPTYSPTADFDNPCNTLPLAEKDYYFEPGRVWYVAVSGSPYEYANSKTVKCRGGCSAATRYNAWDPSYLYEIHITDEYGGPTFAPTLAPTYADTAVYIPSDFISDPFRKQYDKMALGTFLIMVLSAAGFVATRWYFHLKEGRDPGKWPF